jgi:hypothetical protein
MTERSVYPVEKQRFELTVRGTAHASQFSASKASRF